MFVGSVRKIKIGLRVDDVKQSISRPVSSCSTRVYIRTEIFSSFLFLSSVLVIVRGESRVSEMFYESL